jgi:serine-aspartate repeat-containing protein C/D/E
VTSGSTNTTTDAGLYQAASLGNYVWEDTDKDGIQDGTELGVNGVTVQLKNAAGTILQTTTTSTNPTTGGAGYYQFSILYQVIIS